MDKPSHGNFLLTFFIILEMQQNGVLSFVFKIGEFICRSHHTLAQIDELLLLREWG